MAEVVVLVGILVQFVVIRLVVRDRLPFWLAVAATFAALGVVSLFVGDPTCCSKTTVATASVVGAASGLVLFVATRVVVGLATRSDVIRRSVASVYRREEEVSTLAVSVLTLVIAVPGEELFWRGLVLPQLQDATSSTTGALLTWAAAVGVIAAWASAPLLAGAIVGGALWTGLAVWTGGLLSPLISHLVWTGLMLAWPPLSDRAKVTP